MPTPRSTAPPREFQEQVYVLTQACDLAQGKTGAAVVAPVFTAQYVVDRGLLKPAAVRDQVRLGRVFGWYFLPAAGGGIDFPESVVDLRQLYTVPRRTLEDLAAAGRRACRVTTPFREHLAQHFAVTYMRIALPDPYPTGP